jgi:hypothetical protein
VLGQDFWETMQAKIDNERKEIHIGKLTMKYDENDRNLTKSKRLYTVVLESRSETIVQFTTSAERRIGLLGKMEAAPGVYMLHPIRKIAHFRDWVNFCPLHELAPNLAHFTNGAILCSFLSSS